MNYLQKELYLLVREEDHIFSFIQEAALDGLWYWDLESPEDEWMDAKFWTTLGYTPSEMPHKVASWQNLIHPEDLEEAKKRIGAHLGNPEIPYDQIVRYAGKSGKTVWVRCRGKALRDANGKPVRMLGAHQNVTELMENNLALKKTEQELRQIILELDATRKDLQSSEAKLRSLVSSQSSYVIRTDLKGDYTYANETFLNTFSHLHSGLDTLLGTSSMNAIYHGDHEKVIGLIHALIAAPDQIMQIELRKKLPDGSIKHTLWDFACILDPHGAPVEIQCIGIDITQRKADEERIRKLSQAVEQSPASVMVTNLDGSLEYVNKAFCEISGYSPEEVIGRNPRFMKSGKQSPQFYNNLWERITTGHVWHGEFHNRKKNGELFWESASISPVKNDEGEITHYVAVKEDITEKVQHMEDTRLLLTEKEEQNSRLTSFTHIVSHNLRSHSANMIGILNLLEMENPELMSNPYVELLQASSLKLQETITDLNTVLDMSIKGNAARVDLDLHKHVQSTWSSICLLAQDARVALHNDVQEGYTVRVIPSYLQSIILNLLTNAIKYRSHERDSEVRVAAWRDEDHHVITVTDNGIGIDLNRHQNILFGMYKTFHEHQDSKGLGLFMVKNQVEAMGGAIQVVSEVGEGTTFTILLPLTGSEVTPR